MKNKILPTYHTEVTSDGPKSALWDEIFNEKFFQFLFPRYFNKNLLVLLVLVCTTLENLFSFAVLWWFFNKFIFIYTLFFLISIYLKHEQTVSCSHKKSKFDKTKKVSTKLQKNLVS